MHTNQDASDLCTFESFGLKESIMKALTEASFKVPSPIQQRVIPLILSGADVVGQAQTGTGKTAAFALPAINAIERDGGVQLLVITPTRELASQVTEEVCRFGTHCGIKGVAIYGGSSFGKQIEAVRRGVQVVVATPGRLLDLLESNRLPNFNPKLIVLDEADEMLDMGFLDDIQKIFTYLPKKRQTLLFSATMPVPIQNLAKKILKDPSFVKVTQNETTSKDVTQSYCVVQEHERESAIIRLFDSKQPQKAVIFCRTKREVDQLSYNLIARGYLAKGLHGDMQQNQREIVLRDFREGKITTLVATDVAARGLNVVDVSHVFNYHLPFDAESYTHRIGRTGRAGRKGEAISFVTPSEAKKLQRFSQVTGSAIERVFVPTHNDVKKVRVSKLLEEIMNQPLKSEAPEILESLKEKMLLEDIASKLISKLLLQQSLEGPDEIGVQTYKLDKPGREPFENRGRRDRKKFSFPRKKTFSKDRGQGKRR